MRTIYLEVLALFFGRTPWQGLASVLIGAGMVLVLGSRAWPTEALLAGYALLLPGLVLALRSKPPALGPIVGLAMVLVMVPFFVGVGAVVLVERWKSIGRRTSVPGSLP